MAVLDENWMTADQVYDELPADVHMVSPEESVREALDKQVALGVISSRSEGDDVEYNSKSGTVNPGDVL